MATVTASLSLIQEANVIKTYGNWVITISASSSTIAARGGTSTITVSARRTLTYTSGAVGNETGTPTLSFAGTNGYADILNDCKVLVFGDCSNLKVADTGE